jgi:hypothetical protein
MAVMAKEAWTDERLDDLNQRVDEGFKETREEFRAVRSEMKSEFQAVRAEIGALHRMTFQLFAGMILTLVFGFGGMIVALITQT